jgi:hypothetical protein
MLKGQLKKLIFFLYNVFVQQKHYKKISIYNVSQYDT